MIMKLLAKMAEERYQTAAGLAADLKHCLAAWERDGSIAPFAPGTQDIPDQLRIPEKLYGREREVGRLLAAFDRAVAQSAKARPKGHARGCCAAPADPYASIETAGSGSQGG
jgi:hypothetical protein